MTSRAVHPERTCVVEGCPSRSSCFPSWFICGRHYRLGAPVGSPLRRALLRARRLTRRYHTREAYEREDRLWRAIIRRATERDKCGFLDTAVINELLGG